MKKCPANGMKPCVEDGCAWWVEYKTTPTWNRCAVTDISATLIGIYNLVENETDDRRKPNDMGGDCGDRYALDGNGRVRNGVV